MGIFGTPLSGEEVSIAIIALATLFAIFKTISDYQRRIGTLEDEQERLSSDLDKLASRFNCFVDGIAKSKIKKSD